VWIDSRNSRSAGKPEAKSRPNLQPPVEKSAYGKRFRLTFHQSSTLLDPLFCLRQCANGVSESGTKSRKHLLAGLFEEKKRRSNQAARLDVRDPIRARD
jgi:hypothetical protein